MRLQELDPKFGEPTAHPISVLLEHVRQRAERETLRALVGFAYHAHARELIAELEAELAGIEAEIAELEARATLAGKQATEADKRYNDANKRAHLSDTAAEKDQARVERRAALNERAAAWAAVQKANRKAAELRQPLPGMVSFLQQLRTVEPPDVDALPWLAALDQDQAQDDAPARCRGRKKRG